MQCVFVVTGPPRRESRPLLRCDPILCDTALYAILSPQMYATLPGTLVYETPPMIRRIDSGSLQRSATTMGTVVSGDKRHGAAGLPVTGRGFVRERRLVHQRAPHSPFRMPDLDREDRLQAAIAHAKMYAYTVTTSKRREGMAIGRATSWPFRLHNEHRPGVRQRCERADVNR